LSKVEGVTCHGVPQPVDTSTVETECVSVLLQGTQHADCDLGGVCHGARRQVAAVTKQYNLLSAKSQIPLR